jgi:hypothetical protein
MSDLKFLTYCEIDGVEHDPVEVYVDASPAEPDVNWGGSFDVTSVTAKGRDLMESMTDAEIESLTERLYQDSCDAAEYSRY